MMPGTGAERPSMSVAQLAETVRADKTRIFAWDRLLPVCGYIVCNGGDADEGGSAVAVEFSGTKPTTPLSPSG